MRNRIVDEFTHLPISRQRKYQLRMQRDKRCTECGEPAAEGSRCLNHLVKAPPPPGKKTRRQAAFFQPPNLKAAGKGCLTPRRRQYEGWGSCLPLPECCG